MKKNVNLANITILDLLFILTKKYGSKPALQIKDDDGLRAVSYDDLRERSVGVSSFLIKNDIKPNSHIAILSENRPEWAIAFFGIISAACITIPVDAKLSAKEINFILSDSEAECICVSESFLKTVLELKNDLPRLKHIVCFDKCDDDNVIYLNDLKRSENEPANRPSDVAAGNTVVIVYTSGTTGVAKGVELTYKNLLFEVMSLFEAVGYNSRDSFFSILPLNHMLGITGGLIGPLYAGAKVTYCNSVKPNHIVELMKEVKATKMICVPLVIKMLYLGIMKQINKASYLRQKMFAVLFNVSKFSLKLGIPLGKIIFQPIKNKFGGRFGYFVSGGAPLDKEIEINFDIMGFAIMQGYGLTETSPVAAISVPGAKKYGSVGRPLEGVEIKIDKKVSTDTEGEILIKGPNIMKGYYKNPQQTEEVLKDGWFYTGDLGYFDEEGYLYVSGRIKNMIVLGAGKKVFPEEVEHVLSQSEFVKEICVLGLKASEGLKKGTEEVYALIVPEMSKFAKEDREAPEKIKAVINREIMKYSKDLAKYKRPADFCLYNDELPKTSTKKIKRKEALKILEEITTKKDI
jgi:long-chain acyl-CoA synthetase